MTIAHATQSQATLKPGTCECPVCGGHDAFVFIGIDSMPVLIGHQFGSAAAARDSARGPISLAYCAQCSFIWNAAFNPNLLVYDQYDNSLHYSSVFQEYTQGIVARLVNAYNLHGKTIVDIGCGGGDFLEMLCASGNNRGIGFDPTHEGDLNPAGRPVTFVRDMFSEVYGCAGGDFICSRYVLEHVPDPGAFLAMIRRSIGKRTGTVVYFEVPNVELILRDLSVWDIIYEHCSYFSAASLARIFYDRGFHVHRLADGYGGQFLCIDAIASAMEDRRTPRHHELKSIAGEVELFGNEFERRIAAWRARLAEWKSLGKRAAAWGAGAKAVGFLNMLGAGDEIAGVIDINPNKRGTFLAGTGHRVLAPEELPALRPDTIIIMNPIYAGEIRERLRGMNLDPELMEA
ncbi:class I SAM-dependent methyltransferase [bacterium]|nr:class I SAM-dependent methyltransferase [bacterium]